MEQRLEGIWVERARPPDSEQIAAFISRAWPQAQPVTRDRVVGHLGKAGLLMARDGEQIVGVLGFQVENLVTRVTGFLILPARFRAVAGSALLTTMEEMARELRCEAAILLVAPDAPPDIRAYWQSFGFEAREVGDLPSAWRQAARHPRLGAHERLLVKPLRADDSTYLFS